MANYVVSDTSLTAVADAIRAKGGTSAQLEFPAEFVSAIAAIPTGGGGASNIVTGTFKGTTTGSVLDIDVPYEGSGYPIALVIFPEGGWYGNATFSQTIARFNFALFSWNKKDITTPPSYTGSSDEAVCRIGMYKSGASDPTKLYSVIETAAIGYRDTDPSSANAAIFKSATKLSLSIVAPSNYGFMANVDHRYFIIYSS